MDPSQPSGQFRVDQLDHVELFVHDRYEAADWYRQVLGLHIVAEYEHWAADPRGPLMISSDHGNTKLALFQGQPPPPDQHQGTGLVAFRVDADAFGTFLLRLNELKLTDHLQRPVTPDRVVDHQMAYSIYFSDPCRNRLELTCYDYAKLNSLLSATPKDCDP